MKLVSGIETPDCWTDSRRPLPALRRLLIGAAVLGVLAGTARPDTLAVDFKNPGSSASCLGEFGRCTFGYDFTVNSSIALSALGVFAPSGHFAENHPVAIWTAAGSLLASTTVTNASTPVRSADSAGDWLFSPINPILLMPGTYVIGELSLADTVEESATVLTQPQVSFGNARFEEQQTGKPTFPDLVTPAVNAGFFGPSFEIAPEPGSLFLLGLGLLALGWRRLKPKHLRTALLCGFALGAAFLGR